MSLTPSDLQEIVKNVATHNVEQMIDAWDAVEEQGWGLFEKASSHADQLEFFTHEPRDEEPWGTYNDEYPYILDPEYLDLYKAGLLPAVESPSWAPLLLMPTKYFLRRQRLFIRLLGAEAKKRGIDMAAVGGSDLSPAGVPPTAPTPSEAY